MPMSGVATPNGSWTVARQVRRLAPLLLVAGLLTALPHGGSSTDTATGGARRDGLDRARAFTLTDTAATRPPHQERRGVPLGTLPARTAAALVALGGWVAARARRRIPAKPRVAFRRRAPPLLRTA
jgi:hypothetical protein